MFKFFALCLLAVLAVAAAKPGIVASPFAHSAYSSPLLAASPYTAAAYTHSFAAAPYSAYTAGYASPYYASYASPYVAASPYTAAYSSYPYSSLLLRR